MQNILTKYKNKYFPEAEIWIAYTNKKKVNFSEIKEKQIKTVVRRQKTEKSESNQGNFLYFFQPICKIILNYVHMYIISIILMCLYYDPTIFFLDIYSFDKILIYLHQDAGEC